MFQESNSNSLLGTGSLRLNVRPYSRIFLLCLDTPHVPFIRNENGGEPNDPLSPSTTKSRGRGGGGLEESASHRSVGRKQSLSAAGNLLHRLAVLREPKQCSLFDQ